MEEGPKKKCFGCGSEECSLLTPADPDVVQVSPISSRPSLPFTSSVIHLSLTLSIANPVFPPNSCRFTSTPVSSDISQARNILSDALAPSAPSSSPLSPAEQLLLLQRLVQVALDSLKKGLDGGEH